MKTKILYILLMAVSLFACEESDVTDWTPYLEGNRMVIDLSSASMVITVGDQTRIKAWASGTFHVEWTSSNTTVATVKDGVVTALSAGSCTITASVAGNKNAYATCEVRVVPNPSDGSQEFVDLGLPSGTLWATCNVGASNPWEYGNYFAWGETEPQMDNDYSWKSYKWSNGSSSTLFKYCKDSSFGYNGFTDGKTVLDPADDAATANWGIEWKMPTEEQIKELYSNCTCQIESLNDIYGCIFTGSNGNSIFLPMAGSCEDGWIYSNTVWYGCYWSSSLYTGGVTAYYLSFSFGYSPYERNCDRNYGFPVRPVRSVLVSSIVLSATSKTMNVGDSETITATISPSGAYSAVIWSSSNTNVAIVSDGAVTAISAGSCTITATAADGSGITASCEIEVVDPNDSSGVDSNGRAYVDLGLPSGTLWASCNVGANAPEEYGDYFAWGETSCKIYFNSSDYKWYRYNGASFTTVTKYCTNSSIGTVDDKTVLESDDDAATASWGTEWRMPTQSEMQELYDNTTCTWTTLNGVNGRKLDASNGNWIFLPAAGNRLSSFLYDVGSVGRYWSSSLNPNDPYKAYYLFFNSDYVYSDINDSRAEGHSVRPVRVL